MADWLTHILLTWAAVEVVSLRYSKVENYRVFALAGAILPDIGNFTMFLGELENQLSPYFFPLHSPKGIVLLTIPISLMMMEDHEKNVFYLLTLGALFHIAVDCLITTLTGKIPLLFPYSFELYGFDIFSQGGWQFPALAIILALVATGIKQVYKRLGKSN